MRNDFNMRTCIGVLQYHKVLLINEWIKQLLKYKMHVQYVGYTIYSDMLLKL